MDKARILLEERQESQPAITGSDTFEVIDKAEDGGLEDLLLVMVGVEETRKGIEGLLLIGLDGGPQASLDGKQVLKGSLGLGH
jgi:hypothetical protein